MSLSGVLVSAGSGDPAERVLASDLLVCHSCEGERDRKREEIERGLFIMRL